MGRYAKLIMVTGENNNKFYTLTESAGHIDVEYGRVDSTSVKIIKPLNEWDKIIKSKIKKGYKDVTHLVSVIDDTKTDDVPKILVDIDDKAVARFMSIMKAYTDGLVSSTYSIKATSVTQTQIDEAQKIINDLQLIDAVKNETDFNTKLIELYMIIPRYMGHVKDYLIPKIDPVTSLQQEQDNLDAMASQVSMLHHDDEIVDEVVTKNEQSLLDVLGITMKESTVNADTQYLIDQIKKGDGNYGYSRNNVKVEAIFEVNKVSENKTFERWLSTRKDKSTRMLIHGTRNTSVIPILEQGLKIRPIGNYQFSGKAYGDGNYFSEHVQKSLGYVGNDNDKVLLVYEVHTGNPYVYDGWYRGNNFKLTYNELNKRDFDSTYVKAGNGLLNSEIIAYKEEQSRIKYIIYLKN